MEHDEYATWPTGRLLSTAARMVEQAWNARLRDHGVTHAGVVVLATLLAGPADQRQLARAQHVTEQTIGRTLAHLESTGHVERRADPTDRRRRVVQLSTSGRELLTELSASGEQLTERILQDAGQDAAAVRAGLVALVTALAGPPAQGAEGPQEHQDRPGPPHSG
jgi:DNA-binding MarR family transcriptional regulator